MDWTTENYVRLYVRDTAAWLQVSPQARWFFWELLRHLDATGSLSLGTMGPKAVCPVVHAPWALVEPLLAELMEDGCVQINGSVLTVPNFEEAQKACSKSKRRHQRGAKHNPQRTTEARNGLVH